MATWLASGSATSSIPDQLCIIVAVCFPKSSSNRFDQRALIDAIRYRASPSSEGATAT